MKRTALVLLLLPALLSFREAPAPAHAGEPAASAAVRRTISAYIDGPYELYSRGPHTWTASPSGGTYSYQWEVRWDIDPNQTWVPAGNDPTASFAVEPYHGSFELRLTVTSGSNVGYAHWYVYNMQ